jgi:hypothetical protein
MFSPASAETEKHAPSESVLVNGIAVLLALLENRKAVKLTDTGVEAVAGSGVSVAPNPYESAANFSAGEASSEPTLSPEELAQQQQVKEPLGSSL